MKVRAVLRAQVHAQVMEDVQVGRWRRWAGEFLCSGVGPSASAAERRQLLRCLEWSEAPERCRIVTCAKCVERLASLGVGPDLRMR